MNAARIGRDVNTQPVPASVTMMLLWPSVLASSAARKPLARRVRHAGTYTVNSFPSRDARSRIAQEELGEKSVTITLSPAASRSAPSSAHVFDGVLRPPFRGRRTFAEFLGRKDAVIRDAWSNDCRHVVLHLRVVQRRLTQLSDTRHHLSDCRRQSRLARRPCAGELNQGPATQPSALDCTRRMGVGKDLEGLARTLRKRLNESLLIKHPLLALTKGSHGSVDQLRGLREASLALLGEENVIPEGHMVSPLVRGNELYTAYFAPKHAHYFMDVPERPRQIVTRCAILDCKLPVCHYSFPSFGFFLLVVGPGTARPDKPLVTDLNAYPPSL